VTDEELVKQMLSTDDEMKYQFSSLEYMRAVRHLAKDRDSYKETVDRFMWSLTDKCKQS
jgi:hypothetical protein